MNKVIIFTLISGMLVSPLLPHTYLPDLYQAINQNFPSYGLVLAIALDVCWLWFILLVVYLLARFTWQKRLSK